MIILLRLVLFCLLFIGIVIDWLWVGHSKIWVIPEMKGYPFLRPFLSILKKRSIYTVMYLLLALIPAGIIVLMPCIQ